MISIKVPTIWRQREAKLSVVHWKACSWRRGWCWSPAGNECASTCYGIYICSRLLRRCPGGGCTLPSRPNQRRGTSFVGTFVWNWSLAITWWDFFIVPKKDMNTTTIHTIKCKQYLIRRINKTVIIFVITKNNNTNYIINLGILYITMTILLIK